LDRRDIIKPSHYHGLNFFVIKSSAGPTVRLLPEARERLYARADKDGMTLSRLIDKLLEFGLKETETVLIRRQEKDTKTKHT
jgi:hypothetical protein